MEKGDSNTATENEDEFMQDTLVLRDKRLVKYHVDQSYRIEKIQNFISSINRFVSKTITYIKLVSYNIKNLVT